MNKSSQPSKADKPGTKPGAKPRAKAATKPGAKTAPPLQVKRTGTAALLLPLLRPGDARGATLRRDGLTLDMPLKPLGIALNRIERVEVKRGWLWHRVRIQLAKTSKTVSGLGRQDATALAKRLDAASLDWWRTTLKAHSAAIRSAHARIAKLAAPSAYTRHSQFTRLEDDAAEITAVFPRRHPAKLAKSDGIKKLKAIREFARNPAPRRPRANTAFIESELKRSRSFFDTVESNALTDEQRQAVVVDEDHNLVVAAAGSGKTSVVMAKAGWLIKRGCRDPAEILLLAFARDAKEEMENRIKRRLGAAASSPLKVQTFHSLGLAIIGEAEGRRPSLAKVAEDDWAMREMIKTIVQGLLETPEFYELMMTWFQNHFAQHKSETDFKTHGEYARYVKQNDLRSLKGERLKSYEECLIANFLFLQGVPYEYEKDYRHKTATAKKRQYKPDFTLTAHDIHIEHFGISRTGETAPRVNSKEYLDGMEWKREQHKTHGTKLIVTYSYENADGVLISNLKKKLKVHGVEFSPIPPDRIFDLLEKKGRVDPFVGLIATFLGRYKAEGYTIDKVLEREVEAADQPRTAAFLKVFEMIFQKYEGRLEQSGEIDFNDMISRATGHVESGRYASPYGYILVDEFQDIAPGRARLLKALLNNRPDTQLFAVGDDWQAIYRFAGSDISIMREFAKHFGASERTDLTKVFRCPQRISSIAAKFVLQNPDQLQKCVSSTQRIKGPCVTIGLPARAGRDVQGDAGRSGSGAAGSGVHGEAGQGGSGAAGHDVHGGAGSDDSGAAGHDLHDQAGRDGSGAAGHDLHGQAGRGGSAAAGHGVHGKAGPDGSVVEGQDILDEAVQRIEADAAGYSEKSSVMILGRFKHSKPDRFAEIKSNHPELKFTYMTAHRSKGQEADYVIVVGLNNETHGFPSQVAGDPILELVQAEPEKFPRAEERRLFYVAMTRAKRRVFLLAEGEIASPFINELYEGDYDVDFFGREPGGEVACPVCIEGYLVPRKNSNNRSTFYSCTNWPGCHGTQPSCPNCGSGLPVKKDGKFICRDCGQQAVDCPECDGWLLQKKGQYGPFVGCANWSECLHTESACPHCKIGVVGKTDGTLKCQGCGEPAHACPGCGRGWLLHKKGKHGFFIGCSKYPVCEFTRNISGSGM